MLARLLFATVWLIIAAGLLLPLVPLGEEVPGAVAGNGVRTISDAMGADCDGCAPAAARNVGCGAFCPCHHLLPATAADHAICLSLTVHLVVQPMPDGRSREPSPLPPKLPTI